MSSITGMALNAIYPSGLVDRQQAAVPQTQRLDSSLFVPVAETMGVTRQENRREINPDERRRGDINADRRPSDSGLSGVSMPAEEASPVVEQSAQGPGRRQGEGDMSQREAAQLRELQELARRDREVRSHEQAHKAIAGQYAGVVSYDYRQGPDGRRYAVSGSVDVDLRPAESPQETIQKMEKILRAALAPSEPSAADRQIAAQANQLILQARTEALSEQRNARSSEGNGREPGTEGGPLADVSTPGEAMEPASIAAAEARRGDRQEDAPTLRQRERLDELRLNRNTEAQERLLEVQAAIAILLRNQGGSLDDLPLGRNINYQI